MADAKLTIDETGNDYAAARREKHNVTSAARTMVVIAVACAVFFIAGLIVPQNIFDEGLHQSGYNSGYSLSWFVSDLTSNATALFAFFAGDMQAGSSVGASIATYLVIMAAGASLALCGALYQTTFRNALVTPSTLGVMSGAMLGMALWVVLFYDEGTSHGLWLEQSSGTAEGAAGIWASYGLSLCSFVGCIFVVGCVLGATAVFRRSGNRGVMMIVTGQVVAAIIGAVVETLRYYYVTVDAGSAKAQMLQELQIASFYRSYSPVDVACVAVPLLALFAFVMVYRRQLMLLSFSEGEARAMGVETGRLRVIVVVLSTLLTAIVVSFCGRVGFVGFIVPHLARRLVGPNLTYLIPASLLLGAALVLGAYVLICIVLGTGYSTMAGMFVSIAGAAIFLFTVLRSGGGAHEGF